ncbi:MAG: putative transport system permease, partial [Paenibacillus sp.]|nr:putative transport system permease [Paenibacillus sp.]
MLKLNSIIRYVFLSLCSVIFVFPLYWMVTGSLKQQISIWALPPDWFPKIIHWGYYKHLFVDNPTLGWLGNSVFICLVSVVFILIISAMAGYSYAKKQFP